MKKYDEADVVRSLSKNPNIKISKGYSSVSKGYCSGVIEVVKDAPTVGNGSWGKIDYLCNYCGYIYVFIKKEPKTVETSSKKRKKEVKSGKTAMSAFDNKVLKMRK